MSRQASDCDSTIQLARGPCSPGLQKAGGAVCGPLKALFPQWVPDFLGAVAGLWAVLRVPGVHYCSPGPGGCFPFRVAVGPPGGGSCAGSEVSARLFPNSQTIGNLGIAIPKVNSRQLAGIPGIQRNPSCARGSRFVRPPLGLQFPRGKRNPEGGGFAMPLRDLLQDPLDRAGRFYPSPKFFGFVCASRPRPVKRWDPFGVGGGGACPSTSLGPLSPG